MKYKLIRYAVIGISAGLFIFGMALTKNYLSKFSKPKTQATASPEPTKITECPNENDRVQLVDAEKCKWECSSYLTAPAEQRCSACKGVVMPQKCPQCPPLCAPSVWLMEHRK